MAIVADNIVKEYKRRGKVFRAVDNVSICVPEGEITTIMGYSGSGKSTLLSILSGMIRPEKGEINIDGDNVYGKYSDCRDGFRSGRIAVIPQMQSLIPYLNVHDNIILQTIFGPADRKADEERLGVIVEALGLTELLQVYPENLSGGEMKRVAIARALMGDFKYIFADEPTGELDKANTLKVMQLFEQEAAAGKGILIVTHDNLLADLSDSLYNMDQGRI